MLFIYIPIKSKMPSVGEWMGKGDKDVGSNRKFSRSW